MRFLFPVIAALALLVSPAHAQIDDIFDDIFGKRGSQHPYPQDQHPAFGLIDNIPVDIYIHNAGGLDDHFLIVTAYAAPAPNVRQASPRMIGQTQLLLNGLGKELQIIVAAPEPVTRDIDYARIEARIVDANGNTLFREERSGEYRGRMPAKIDLIRPGGSVSNPQPGSRPGGVETVRGSVRLQNGSASNFRGATLVVELIDDGLAGGPNGGATILGQTRVDIDQKSAPYDFSLDAVMPQTQSGVPTALRAYIEDWAGRRTMETPSTIPYRGPGERYNLTLAPFAGETVTTGAGSPSAPSPAPGNPASVTGEARFDAVRGLPAGSRLIVTVSRGYGTPSQDRTIFTDVTQLDGLSGYVGFDFAPGETLFESGRPDPVIKAVVVDSRDRVFFESQNQPLTGGFNTIRLEATPNY